MLLARLRSLRDSGAIVVLATHDLDLADGLFDEVLFLRDGRVVSAVAQPAQLRSTYRDVLGRG
jgi:ABC-type multidrug transport system ATPase subunit